MVEREVRGASSRVREVVVAAGTVIDAVRSDARGAALQPDELLDQTTPPKMTQARKTGPSIVFMYVVHDNVVDTVIGRDTQTLR